MPAPKKMGRPKSDSPKKINVTIRLDKDEKEKLDIYCKNNNISISEIFRKQIAKLKI